MESPISTWTYANTNGAHTKYPVEYIKTPKKATKCQLNFSTILVSRSISN